MPSPLKPVAPLDPNYLAEYLSARRRTSSPRSKYLEFGVGVLEQLLKCSAHYRVPLDPALEQAISAAVGDARRAGRSVVRLHRDLVEELVDVLAAYSARVA